MAFIVALKKAGRGKGEANFDELAMLQADARLPLPTSTDPNFICEGVTVTHRTLEAVTHSIESVRQLLVNKRSWDLSLHDYGDSYVVMRQNDDKSIERHLEQDRSHKNRGLEKKDHGPYNKLEADDSCPDQMVDWASPLRSGGCACT